MNDKVAQRNKYLIAAAVGAGLFFLGGIIYSIILMIDYGNKKGRTDFENDKYVMSMLQYLSYVPFMIFAVYFLKDDLVKDFKNFKKNPSKMFIVIVGSFGLMYVLNIVINIIYQDILNIQGTSENENLINDILLSNAAIPMIISVCILAPISEEILFRKMLFGVCEKSFNMPWWLTIVVSTLIFSFIHVSDIESLKFIFQYIPLAAVMCICYHYTDNNIWASIILHAINNILGVIGIYFLY